MKTSGRTAGRSSIYLTYLHQKQLELELELILSQMTQKPMLRGEVHQKHRQNFPSKLSYSGYRRQRRLTPHPGHKVLAPALTDGDANPLNVTRIQYREMPPPCGLFASYETTHMLPPCASHSNSERLSRTSERAPF